MQANARYREKGRDPESKASSRNLILCWIGENRSGATSSRWRERAHVTSSIVPSPEPVLNGAHMTNSSLLCPPSDHYTHSLLYGLYLPLQRDLSRVVHTGVVIREIC